MVVVCWLFNPFVAVTRKFSVMTESLLRVFGSCERHSEPTKRDVRPFETDTKGGFLIVDVSVKWATIVCLLAA